MQLTSSNPWRTTWATSYSRLNSPLNAVPNRRPSEIWKPTLEQTPNFQPLSAGNPPTSLHFYTSSQITSSNARIASFSHRPSETIFSSQITPHYKMSLIPLRFSSLPDSTLWTSFHETLSKSSSSNLQGHQIPNLFSQLLSHTLWKANTSPSQYEIIDISPKMTHN